MEMNQYGQTHNTSDEVASLHSDFGPNMIKDEQQNKPKQPLISFKYHPGFFCFFEDYTNRQGWTFYECYQKVFQSHHELMKIRHPVSQVISAQNLDKTQKITELAKRAQKDKIFAYYLKRPQGQLECNIVVNEDSRIERINKLKQSLQKLEKIKTKVVEQKKKQFQLKEIQRSKQQQLEIESIMTEKQRRASLIQKIILDAENKRIERQQERRLKRLMNKQEPSLFSSVGLDNCKIM